MIVLGDDVVRFVDSINGGAFDPNAVGIGWAPQGRIIGGVKFDNWNGRSICMHVASDAPNWLSRELLWYSFYYPFEQLRVSKILGVVAESNLAARRFDEKVGFRLEYSIADAHPDGALLIYSMTREQCRYLEMHHRFQKQPATSPGL